MRKRVARTITTIAILCMWSGLAFAELPELEFAKGVVAFSRGDLREAEQRFRAVLEQQPDHPQATYYLGQAALGLKKFDSAAELFRRAIRLQPSNRAIRLDLALALVRLKQFEDAESELQAVADALSDRASFQYYLGFCRYRLGRYRQALAPLRRARDLDQGFKASAGYYLGLAHFKLGEQEEASRQFRQVASGEAGERMTAFARQNLSLLAEERRDAGAEARRWGAFASAGGGFDSNVTLTPTDASGLDTATAFLSAGGFYSPILSRHDQVRISANVYRSFHTRDNVTGFNLTDLSATAQWQHRFTGGHRLELAYLFDLDMLDGGGEAGQILGHRNQPGVPVPVVVLSRPLERERLTGAGAVLSPGCSASAEPPAPVGPGRGGLRSGGERMVEPVGSVCGTGSPLPSGGVADPLGPGYIPLPGLFRLGGIRPVGRREKTHRSFMDRGGRGELPHS
jgi:TolA-binding protein